MAVPGEGNPDADVYFYWEAPGKKEAATGRPFIAVQEQLFRSLISKKSLDDEKDVYITSPVKYYRLIVSTPTSADIAHGRIHLRNNCFIKPKVVMLLGELQHEGVLEKKVALRKEHGAIIEERDGIKYFLTVHPCCSTSIPKQI